MDYLAENITRIKDNPRNIADIDQTNDLCFLAVSLNPFTLSDIRDQSEALCKLAIMLEPESFRCIRRMDLANALEELYFKLTKRRN